MPLFDDIDRNDPSPATHGEDSFTFLNRVATPYWSRIRDALEQWFSRYPVQHQVDLRARFRDPGPALHWAAWWELYLYTLFSRLGYNIEVHPDIATGTSRPDFRLQLGAQHLILEAVTVFSGIVEEGRHPTLEAHLLRIIGDLHNPNFSIHLEFDRVGTQAPRRQEVTRPIAAWLQSLDPDAVIQGNESGVDLPETVLAIRDWQLRIRALPVRRESRGRPDHSVLGMGPSSTGYVNDVDKLRSAIHRKSKHYGDLGLPFVVAALSMAPGMSDEDVHETVSGRVAVQVQLEPSQRARLVRLRDGAWNRRPESARVSALLSGINLLPWTCAGNSPRLWFNPACDRPLQMQTPFPTAICTPDGQCQFYDGLVSAVELLGLPHEWPGPEAPFPD